MLRGVEIENTFVCASCQREFDIAPIMLGIADDPQADWDAPIHCPHCDATTIASSDNITGNN